MSAGFVFFLFIWAMFVGLIATALVVKVREVRVMKRWPATTGKVIASRVEAHRRVPGEMGYSSSDTNIINYPYIEYQYTVGGRTLRSHQITLGETPSKFPVEETLAKYPVGAAVAVYYDPADPGRTALEREWPAGLGWGLVCVIIIFIGLPLLGVIAYTNATAWLSHHIPRPGQASAVAFLGGMGSMTIWFGLAYTKMVVDAYRWPIARGRIVATEVDAFPSRERSETGMHRTMFKPVVIYTYEVDGQRYAGDRVTIGLIISSTVPGLARLALRKYPEGSEVSVRYNPAKPSEAVLHPWSPWSVLIGVAAVGLFALAWAIATGKIA